MLRFVRVAQVAILLFLTGFIETEGLPPSDAIAARSGPTEVAAAYLTAMESGNLEAAEVLFAAQSSVFESGGQEGNWQHYREHHIGPELAQFESFSITRGEAEVEDSQDGTMAFVAWPVEYRIALGDQRVIESVGTVTFVLVSDGNQFRIRHLHWSSRRKRPPDG